VNGFRAALLAFFAPLLALVGCDAGISQLKPGVSTTADVQRVLGNPTFEWREADGGRTWEFARGPEGVVTYMIALGPDGVLKAIRQVLTDAEFAKIQAGMSGDAVRRLVGRPGLTTPFPNLQETVWSWKYEVGTEAWYYNVHFAPDGTVKRTSRQKFEAGGISPP